MTLQKGWINRQISRAEQDAKNWPEWMRRETGLRAGKQKDSEKSSTQTGDAAPAVKKAGGE
jgi:hypothetical protein